VSGEQSGSKASASTEDSDKKVSSTGSGNEFFKLWIIDEPRANVLVDFDMLQPTVSLQKAIVKFQNAVDSGSDKVTAAVRVFKKFGTHICPSVTLGGMWELRAQYISKSSKSDSEMSRVCTQAIQEEKTRALSASVSASGFGGSMSASFSGGDSKSSSSQGGQGSKAAKSEEQSDSRVEVEQEWKGGASGAGPAAWRESLAVTKNSNWKIIDTDLDRCIPHWEWVTPEAMGSVFNVGITHKMVRQNLFDAYRSVYFPTGIQMKLDVDLTDAWLAIKSGGFEENAATCDKMLTQEEKDKSCQGLMRCWQKGKKYGDNIAAVGCNDNACCTKMEDFPAGASCCGFTPGETVCAEGLECRSCQCSAPTTTTTTTTFQVATFSFKSQAIHGNVNAYCDAGTKIVGGGCSVQGGCGGAHCFDVVQQSVPFFDNGNQGWYCGQDARVGKTAIATCVSGGANIVVKESGLSGDMATSHCDAGQKLLGGGCMVEDLPHNKFWAISAPVAFDSAAPGWKCAGHGGRKKAWAMCTSEGKPTMKVQQFPGGGTVICDAGMSIVGGGCEVLTGAHKMAYNGPVNGNAWRCDGHHGVRNVYAICSYPWIIGPQPVCDWGCYANRYADLREMAKGDHGVLKNHYYQHGMKEKRDCSCSGGR